MELTSGLLATRKLSLAATRMKSRPCVDVTLRNAALGLQERLLRKSLVTSLLHTYSAMRKNASDMTENRFCVSMNLA